MSDSADSVEQTEVALVGAGPIGLELAVALTKSGVDYLHFDAGQIAQTISWFPQQMTFFSSTDRIGIAGVPIQTVGQTKCTKEQYLAYLRSIVGMFDLPVRTYESVTSVHPRDGGGFRLRTAAADGEHVVDAAKVVLATGGTQEPRRLGIPGEDLPHVSHYFDEPHRYFRRRLLVVGGKNSAVEAALRCWHAGADVTISYRGGRFPEGSVKYWLLPEIEGRIARGEITCHYETVPAAVTRTQARLTRADGTALEVRCDFVLLLTGYHADMTLFRKVGVRLSDDGDVPAFDPTTMETNVPGLYVAGTATAGTQSSFQVFLENCHVHVDRIVASLTGAPPPPDPSPRARPES